jgi:hypothetical protein
MKIKTTILILCAILLGCKKDTKVVLSGDLTGCPINTTCSYNYYNNANFSGNRPVAGNYRLFVYKSVDNILCEASTTIYFKTNLSNGDFDITSNQIAGGQVVGYNLICACCEALANVKPMGGEIKGKRLDAAHWLVNASIILGTAINKRLDTLKVNQQFTLTALP